MNFYDIIKDFLLASLVFIPLERWLPLINKQARFRRWWGVDLTHVFLTGTFVQWGAMLVIVVTANFLESRIPDHFQAAVYAQPVAVQFIEILIIADLGFYWVHRAFHEIPCLWRFHTIHHSIEELDYLAAHRVHPLDQILTRVVTLFPIFSLGFDSFAFFLFTVLYHWQSILIHSNIRIEFGPLKWILASPRFHHWHHANHAEAVNKNYAAQLPILDVIFKTLYMPKDKMPERYGINEPVPHSYLGQFIFPFKRKKPEKDWHQKGPDPK